MLCRELGYDKDELVGQKQDLIFTLSTRIFQQTHFFPLLKMQGHAEEIYISLQTRNKEPLPVLINAARTVENGDGITTYVGIVVRNRKKFEDELLAAKKAAEEALHKNTALLQAKLELQDHAERLDQQISLVKKQNEELTQFNHVVTHELQEPLRKLFVFTNMLLEETGLVPPAKTVQKIKSVSEQMREILSGLQRYLWLIEKPVNPARIHLKNMLMELGSQVKHELPEAIFQTDVDESFTFQADKEQFGFLLKEILVNAITFRNPDKVLTITVTATTIQQNRFKNSDDLYRYDDYLKLQVKDNGLGFDATYKDQVFVLYKRLHTISGYGVGLSLCKKVMENHRGSIAIDSKISEGTTVTILLPLLAAESNNDLLHKLNNKNEG